MPIGLARPLLALLMTRASYEEQARWRAGERVYTITRAGCPGIQAYAQVGLTWRHAIVRCCGKDYLQACDVACTAE